MSATAETKAVKNRGFYYYYPNWNEQFPRRVLAGIVKDGVLHIAEAVCFPGMSPIVIPVKLRGGRTTYVVDLGPPADNFNKAIGRAKAEERAQGFLHKPNKKGERVYIGDQTIMKIQLPEGDVNPGKVFVESVERYLKEMGFPAKPKKQKKFEEGPSAGSTAAEI